MGDDDEPVINPGIDYGEDGKAKWSPPQQQELNIMKSKVGVTPDADTTKEVDGKEKAALASNKQENNIEFLKKLIALFK